MSRHLQLQNWRGRQPLVVAELSRRTVSSVHDDLSRLTEETITGDPSGKNGVVDCTPDAAGNRLSRTSTVTAVPSATHGFDSNDRLLSDTNENTRLSGGNIDVYDLENRLISRPGNGNTIALVYDGNRVSKIVNGVTTNYLVDTNNLARYAQVVEELSTVRVYTCGQVQVWGSEVWGSAF